MVKEVFQPSDINDEATWSDGRGISAEYWKIGEPTCSDVVELNRNVCWKMSDSLQYAVGLQALSLAGIGARDRESWEKLLFGLSTNRTIHTLELNQISAQLPVSQFPTCLLKLTLIDCILPESFRLSALPRRLTQLRIIECAIQSTHLQPVGGWDIISSLELLDLRGNPLNHELCVHLSVLLAKALVLQKLVLEDTWMSDELLSTLFSAQVHVRSVNLGDNQLNDANAMLRLMEKHSSVSVLKLQGNPLGCFPFENEANATIRRLDLSSCYTGSVCRSNFLSSMTRLTSLNLSANSMDVATIETIVAMNSLTTLQLHNCQLSDTLCRVLMAGLCLTCSSLHLENNFITCVAPIATWIRQNSQCKLHSLRLAGNPVTDGNTNLVWTTWKEHCWTLVETTGLPDARHWMLLNRAGRSWLTSHCNDNNVHRFLEQLLEAERVYDLNGTYTLLRQVPHVVRP